MTESRFDPGGFYEFNLKHGVVKARDKERVLLLSDTTLAPLVSIAVKQGELKPLRDLGARLGQMISESLGKSADGCTPQQVLGHASSVVSLFGWGRLHLERWGDAMVVRLENPPELDERSLGVAALLGGLFSSFTPGEVASVPVGKEGHFILVDPSVAESVWALSQEGLGLMAVLSRLSAEAA